MSTSDDFEWLKGKVAALRKFTDELCKFSQVHYEAHSWTALKLVALMWWVDVYTKIIPRHRAECWYLDLLAGSGTDFIKETGDIIVGSPFIAYYFSRISFKRHIFIEASEERARTLRLRAQAVRVPNHWVVHGDCNKEITYLSFDKAEHFLTFIDCEGLDVYWSTVEFLLNHPGDLIIVFQTHQIPRILGKAKVDEATASKLSFFMGDDTWMSCMTSDELLEQYINKLRRHRGYVKPIRIRGRYSMDVVLACRPGPYTKAWDDLEKRLSKVDDEDAELALKMLKGEVKALTEFFSAKQVDLMSWLR